MVNFRLAKTNVNARKQQPRGVASAIHTHAYNHITRVVAVMVAYSHGHTTGLVLGASSLHFVLFFFKSSFTTSHKSSCAIVLIFS